MKEIKPIETEYKGYRFRSRLEARWAVFFDAIGAEWEYEPEGFELSDGTKYLPDFLLKNVRGRGTKEIYVEIKGELTDADLRKIRKFGRSFEIDANGNYNECGMPVIIFGQIPECTWNAPRWIDTHVRHYGEMRPAKILEAGWWHIDYSRDNSFEFYNLEYSEGDCYCTEPKAAKDGGLVLDYPDDPYDFVDNDKTAKAFLLARQARFEHGEKPIVRRK